MKTEKKFNLVKERKTGSLSFLILIIITLLQITFYTELSAQIRCGVQDLTPQQVQ